MAAMIFDEPEYRRWVRAAEEHLAAAEHARGGGFHSASVLSAEQAAQCVLKALLHGVGLPALARGHDLLVLAAAATDEAGLELSTEDHAALAELGLQYQPSRYPDALPGGTPGDWFTHVQSATSGATAARLLSTVAARWAELLAAAEDEEDEA